MWGGSIRLTTPMLFAIGFIAMFIIGGLSGVTHAIVPSDCQQQDTYYIVAHFHYVLFGGAIFGLFAGAYYWFPKITGRMYSEGLGKLHFWLMFIGFNLTFGPMHWLGPVGHAAPHTTRTRRHAGWDFWNLVVDDRRVHHRRVGPGVHVNVISSIASGEAGRGRPLGRPHAGVDDPLAAAPLQLRRDPDGAPPRRAVAPRSTREDEEGKPVAGGRPAAAEAADGEAGHEEHARHPHARTVVLPADRRARACRWSGYGLIYNGAGRWPSSAALIILGRAVRVEPASPCAEEDATERLTPTIADALGTPHTARPGSTTGSSAMWAFLGSECLFFGALDLDATCCTGDGASVRPVPRAGLRHPLHVGVARSSC